MWSRPDFHLDFARPLFAWQTIRWTGMLLVILLLLLLLWAYQQNAGLAIRLEGLLQQQAQLTRVHMQAQTDDIPAVLQTLKTPAKSVATLNPPAQKAAQKILQQLNVRWFDLLQALESAQQAEIALLQLTPDANRGQFVLLGEAKSYPDLLNYIKQLQSQPSLHEVHLQKHQVNETHPQRPVSFEIQGGWQP